MCGIYYCMCKSHLHLVSFFFVPALYYTLKFKEFRNMDDLLHVFVHDRLCIVHVQIPFWESFVVYTDMVL